MEKIGGADGNGIQSFDFEIPILGEWGVSFIKKVVECPMAMVRRQKGLPPEEDSPSSFLSLKSMIRLKSHSYLKGKALIRSRNKNMARAKKDDEAASDSDSTKEDKKEDEEESEKEQKHTNEFFKEV